MIKLYLGNDREPAFLFRSLIVALSSCVSFGMQIGGMQIASIVIDLWHSRLPFLHKQYDPQERAKYKERYRSYGFALLG